LKYSTISTFDEKFTMKRLGLIITLSSILSLTSFAQNGSSNLYQASNEKGDVQYAKDYRIDMLSKRFAKENLEEGSMKGYRVQLFFGNREEANAIKTSFLKEYPQYEAYLTYLSPNFRVRVGNFRSKIEADGLLHKLKAANPTAFVVTDGIKLPKL
jgi:hypothetical protein